MDVFMSVLFILVKSWKKITCQRIKWANKVGKCHTAIKVII